MRERDSTLQTTLFGLCKIPSRVLKDTQEIYLATGQSLLSAPGRVPFSEENVPGWLECPPLDIFLRFRLPGPWAPHCEDSLPCPGDLRPRSLALLLLLLLHAYCLPNLLRHRRQRLGGKNSVEFIFCIFFLNEINPQVPMSIDLGSQGPQRKVIPTTLQQCIRNWSFNK